VENQLGGINPHERLAPEASAALIRQHVGAGLELARQNRLPAALFPFIAEHHGTSRLEYFYDQAGGGNGPGDERFRYAGPRPSTSETAIAMLADSAEASVRALEDPVPGELRTAIDRVITNRVGSGELRDAPLTLRDLDRIAETFTRVLGGMHHARLRYPEPAGSAAGGRSGG
jgi:membrane-associated HD superfamily phosphohydrolase